MSTIQETLLSKGEKAAVGKLKAELKQIQPGNYTVLKCSHDQQQQHLKVWNHTIGVKRQLIPSATWPPLHKVRNGTRHRGPTLSKSCFGGGWCGVQSLIPAHMCSNNTLHLQNWQVLFKVQFPTFLLDIVFIRTLFILFIIVCGYESVHKLRRPSLEVRGLCSQFSPSTFLWVT